MNPGHAINVLDHGYVKLIGSMGTEETIVEAARMSTGRGFERWDPGLICKVCGIAREEVEQADCRCNYSLLPHEWKQVPGDLKLLTYLYSNRHMTPFEMCELVIEVQAPIMVLREWHRHRTQSYNEFSARYAQLPNLHYLPDIGRIKKQSKTNKQGSAEWVGEKDAKLFVGELERQQLDIYETYDDWIEDGVANEVARLNTPISRYSKMRAKANLRNWLGFLLLRKKPSAQWEIRQYADVVGLMIQDLWPRVWELFMEYEFEAKTLSRSELRLLKDEMKLPDPNAGPELKALYAKSYSEHDLNFTLKEANLVRTFIKAVPHEFHQSDFNLIVSEARRQGLSEKECQDFIHKLGLGIKTDRVVGTHDRQEAAQHN